MGIRMNDREELSKRMQVLFVHGMGRSPLSGWPMLWRLRRAGLETGTFGYMTSLQDFTTIRDRLLLHLERLATEEGNYIAIGHSLGGVLLRSALQQMAPGMRLPRHLFLLGSPVQPARLARMLGKQPLYRWMTGDCGQLLGSEVRMAAIDPPPVPTTAIAGVRGLAWQRGPFAGEANDGVVALSEVQAAWQDDRVEIDAMHTLLPASGDVAAIVLDRIARTDCNEIKSLRN